MKYSGQLRAILKTTGFSQNQLALKLGVTFSTLNSWLHEKSRPRKKALLKIEQLYLDVVGIEKVDSYTLNETKKSAMFLKCSTSRLISDKKKLDKLTLYLTYHTNTIEGSTMTLSDVEDVIFDHKVLSNRTLIEQAEARNHQATFVWLLDKINTEKGSFKVDEQLILAIHLRLMHGIMSDAGQYRKHAVRIKGVHVPLANWAKIPELIFQLCEEISNDTVRDLIDKIAYTHATFEKIHPFSDGNGRTGRLVMLAQALSECRIPPLIVKERKHAYYKYLEQAQTNGNQEALELLIAQSMLFTAELIE